VKWAAPSCALLGALSLACAPRPAIQLDLVPPPPPAVEPASAAHAPSGAPSAASGSSPPDAACAADEACAYDPVRDRCLVDPRANPQPPVVDQGIVCYCDAARCGTLRVQPVPCESDASCAVQKDPRPHPIAADSAHPHERGRRCRDFVFTTTCERTNICTMHRLRCPRP